MSMCSLLEGLYNEYKKEFENEQIVLGIGSTNANVMLIGEAPGKDEVRLGKPFVGAAGKNLNMFMQVMNLSRQDVYVTNAIKYRLSKLSPKTGKAINRASMWEDIVKNRHYLLKEIEIINPKYIVTLGNVPLKAVTGNKDIKIGDCHGTLKKVTVFEREYMIFPLYHPASIIYNRTLQNIYYKDASLLKEYLMN